VKMMF